jgi:hypothetical protein
VTAASNGIRRWPVWGKRRIGLTKDVKHFAIEIEVFHSHQINDRDTNLFLQQRSTFGNKRLPALRPIFVCWADKLDSRNQFTPSLLIKYQNFVFVILCRIKV